MTLYVYFIIGLLPHLRNELEFFLVTSLEDTVQLASKIEPIRLASKTEPRLQSDNKINQKKSALFLTNLLPLPRANPTMDSMQTLPILQLLPGTR
jgi:hypothetical protein